MRFKTLLSAVLLLLSAACAQAQNAPAGSGPAITQSSVTPGYSTEAETPEHAKGLPSDAKLLRDHLVGDEPVAAGAALVGSRAPGVAGTPGGPGNAARSKDDDLGVASAVKDFVKPIHLEISNSVVVQAVRDFDAGLSGRRFTNAGDLPVRYGPATTGTGSTRKPDAMAATQMWEQFLDDVLPWLAGGALLLLLGYGTFLWLKILKMKKRRVSQRRRHHHRSRRSSRHTAT